MSSFQSFIFEKGIKFSVKRAFKKGVRDKGMDERRKMIDRLGRILAKLPKDCHVEPLSINGIYAEWLSSRNTAREKVILYFHGGGYAYCSASTHRPLAARIGKAAGVKVLFPEYRLAPEHPFPSAIEDAVNIYRWLLQQGYGAENIILAGDSAGAGLSIATTIVLREQNEPLPAAIVCLSPWVDLTSSGESYRKNNLLDPYLSVEGVQNTAHLYAGKEALLEHPLISPVFADFSDFPPLFIQVGNHEILQSDAEKLAAQARNDGVNVTFKIWDGMWHVWQISGDLLPEAKKAIKEIGEYVGRTFNNA